VSENILGLFVLLFWLFTSNQRGYQLLSQPMFMFSKA